MNGSSKSAAMIHTLPPPKIADKIASRAQDRENANGGRKKDKSGHFLCPRYNLGIQKSVDFFGPGWICFYFKVPKASAAG
jgi:hypothetical protein